MEVSSVSKLSLDEVIQFLPHRPPFLFIDSVESIAFPGSHQPQSLVEKKDIIGCTVTANYLVREDLEILAGHFPGNPILPGVVQVEMMAQASCFTLMKLMGRPKDVKLEVALLKIEGAKFRKPIRPGMDLKIKAVCQKIRGHMISYSCSIHHQGETMAEANILAMSNF